MNVGERGEGKLGSIIGFLVMAAIGIAIWNVFPLYWNAYNFQDKMIETARTPSYNCKDECIMDKLMKSARENNIDDYLKPSQCKISTADHNRRIKCEFEIEKQVVPGYKKTFRFAPEADQPLL